TYLQWARRDTRRQEVDIRCFVEVSAKTALTLSDATSALMPTPFIRLPWQEKGGSRPAKASPTLRERPLAPPVVHKVQQTSNLRNHALQLFIEFLRHKVEAPGRPWVATPTSRLAHFRRREPLSQLLHDLRRLAGIQFSVDLGDRGRTMPQHRPSGVQPSRAANLRRLRVPQPVRVPVRDGDGLALRTAFGRRKLLALFARLRRVRCDDAPRDRPAVRADRVALSRTQLRPA